MKKYTKDEIKTLVSQTFAKALGENINAISDNTAFNSHPKWDSLKQLDVVSSLEQTFGIEFAIDDIVEMDTIGKTVEVVSKHLN